MSRLSLLRRRQEALFRFHVIAPLLPPQLTAKERADKLRAILTDPPRHPWKAETPRLSTRTIYRWLHRYQLATGDRLAALEPSPRSDRDRSRVLPQELVAQAISLRETSPRLSVAAILQRIDHPAREQVSRRSVARALAAAGFDLRDKRRRIAERSRGGAAPADWDLARWEADFPNEVWQIDSTPSIWLPAAPGRAKPVRLQLLNIIDDCSRLVVGGGFTEQLQLADLLRLLVPAIARYGCPVSLFADQARIHRATLLAEGLARLGGAVVLGTAGHAPGHGKVEVLHQRQLNTLVEDVRRVGVETCEQANGYFQLWADAYADEMHGETGESPRGRWQRIAGNARIPGQDELAWAFRGRVERTVSEVGAIALDGVSYEAPTTHRRSRPHRVWIRYDLLDRSQVWIEDADGTRHACPVYRVRSHTERRARRSACESPRSLSFSDLDASPDRDGDPEIASDRLDLNP